MRLRQAICRHHLRTHQLRQIFLFLFFGAEQQQRQRADSRMRAMPRREYEPSRANPSATIIADVRSISMPPYCSGTSTAGNPSSPISQHRARRPRLLMLNRVQFGATSLFQNSSVVRAIARCSS
jgi:hypothetical protein